MKFGLIKVMSALRGVLILGIWKGYEQISRGLPKRIQSSCQIKQIDRCSNMFKNISFHIGIIDIKPKNTYESKI